MQSQHCDRSFHIAERSRMDYPMISVGLAKTRNPWDVREPFRPRPRARHLERKTGAWAALSVLLGIPRTEPLPPSYPPSVASSPRASPSHHRRMRSAASPPHSRTGQPPESHQAAERSTARVRCRTDRRQSIHPGWNSRLPTPNRHGVANRRPNESVFRSPCSVPVSYWQWARSRP